MKLLNENLPSWMKNWDFLNSVEQACEKYDLDLGIVLALIQVESGGVYNCLRYEPYFKYVYKPEEITTVYNKRRFITFDTVVEMQKFSYGIMQCMGSLFFEYDFHNKFDYKLLPIDMCNTLLSLDVGCLHLRKKIDQFKLTSALDIYACYNAGSAKLLNGKYKNQTNVNHFNKYYIEVKKILLP